MVAWSIWHCVGKLSNTNFPHKTRPDWFLFNCLQQWRQKKGSDKHCCLNQFLLLAKYSISQLWIDYKYWWLKLQWGLFWWVFGAAHLFILYFKQKDKKRNSPGNDSRKEFCRNRNTDMSRLPRISTRAMNASGHRSCIGGSNSLKKKSSGDESLSHSKSASVA